MLILLTNANTNKKFLIDANSIISAEREQSGIGYTHVYSTTEHMGYKPVLETPEEIAELIAASTSGRPVTSKFIKLHAIKSGEERPICLNIDKIERFYPKDNETFHDKLPDSLSPENVDKNYLTEIHFKTGNSSVSYEFLESYDYICQMLSAR